MGKANNAHDRATLFVDYLKSEVGHSVSAQTRREMTSVLFDSIAGESVVDGPGLHILRLTLEQLRRHRSAIARAKLLRKQSR
jgi:hypothetical protein